jgi:hypothetical protein
MILTWNTMSTATKRVQEVDDWPTLDEAIAAMAKDSWEDTSRKLVDWLTDENGEVVAVSIFGPELELLISCADGRQLRFFMPERYQD